MYWECFSIFIFIKGEKKLKIIKIWSLVLKPSKVCDSLKLSAHNWTYFWSLNKTFFFYCETFKLIVMSDYFVFTSKSSQYFSIDFLSRRDKTDSEWALSNKGHLTRFKCPERSTVQESRGRCVMVRMKRAICRRLIYWSISSKFNFHRDGKFRGALCLRELLYLPAINRFKTIFYCSPRQVTPFIQVKC